MTKKDIIKYRNCWMGFSILWVMFTHSHFGMPNAFLTFIKDIGFISVDGFLFASGLGCYYSLKKNDDILLFLKRRFEKLAPAYYLVIIPFILYKWLILHVPFSMFGVTSPLCSLSPLTARVSAGMSVLFGCITFLLPTSKN